MTVFWLVAAGLVLLAYGLFWWSLHRPPMMDERAQLDANLNVHRSRRLELEQELREGKISSSQFNGLIAELDRELLDLMPPPIPAGRTEGFKGLATVSATLTVIPLIALALYFSFGRPDLISAGTTPPKAQAMPDSLEAAVQRLTARLRDNPADPEGWLLLGRTYQALGQADKAKTVYEQALRLIPENLDLKARYAEVLAQLQEGDLRGKPQLLLQEILKAEPNHPYALWLSGLAALHEGDRELARRYWQTLLDQMPPDSAAANQLREVMSKAGLASQPAAHAPVQVQVKVQLAPGLTSRAHPNDPVYIFARAAQGPPMPLAIIRKQVKDLPLTVTLDDTMAMVPQMKLSNFKRIVLGARVAKSGNAQGAPGDLEGWTNEVAIDKDKPQTIVIDQVRS